MWEEELNDRQPERKPLWREEFSVSRADERYVNRRQLAKFLTLGSLGMFAGNLWILATKLVQQGARLIRLARSRTPARVPVGGVKLFQYPKPGDHASWCAPREDITSPTARNARIFPAPSTMRAKRIGWSALAIRATSRLQDGSVLQGPPTRPLPTCRPRTEWGRLIAIRMEPEA